MPFVIIATLIAVAWYIDIQGKEPKLERELPEFTIDDDFVERYSISAWDGLRANFEPGLPPWEDVGEIHKDAFRRVAKRTAQAKRDIYIEDVRVIINSVMAEGS